MMFTAFGLFVLKYIFLNSFFLSSSSCFFYLFNCYDNLLVLKVQSPF